MKNFKIRCSAIGSIMTDSRDSITEKQLEKIQTLKEKISSPKGLTITQSEELKKLTAKRDLGPQLSETTKTYLKQWYIEDRFNRKKEFSNKFMEKGIAVEDEAIDIYSRFSGREFLKKNEEEFENDHCTGTPDVITDIIIDVKSSWDLFTFPIFDENLENKSYWWQLQGYMWLCDKQEADLAYCLVDTPQKLIEKEIKRIEWNTTVDRSEDQKEIEEETEKNMTFSDIDEKIRVKIFKVKKDEESIEKIKSRVSECRNFLENLNKQI